MRLKDSYQTQYYVLLKAERQGGRICHVEFPTSGVAHAGDRAEECRALVLGSQTESPLVAIFGESLLPSRTKVAPKIMGSCLLLRQVIGGLTTLSQLAVWPSARV